MKTYPASLDIRSAALAVTSGVLFILFFLITVCLTTFESHGSVFPIFLLALYIACGAWAYGLFSIGFKGCEISFLDGILYWKSNGIIFSARKVIPLIDIRDIQWASRFARFQIIYIFTEKRRFSLYAILSDPDCSEMLSAISQAAKAEQDGPPNDPPRGSLEGGSV